MVFQTGDMEEGEQFLEGVFRLMILEKAFHVEESHQSFCLVPGELSCGSEFFRLLPRSGGGLFLLFQIFLLSQFFFGAGAPVARLPFGAAV